MAERDQIALLEHISDQLLRKVALTRTVHLPLDRFVPVYLSDVRLG